MWTETTEGRKYIEEVSRYIVTDLAPEELDHFDELIQEYFAAPAPPDLFGFGLGATLVAVTPAAVAVVRAVLTHVLTEAVKGVQDESAAAVKKKIKGLFNPEKKDDGPEPLTREQLKQVKRIARRVAKQFGMEPDAARKMADILVGALALAG